MFGWMLGSKLHLIFESKPFRTDKETMVDCRDEYYAGISYETLARRILSDARDIATCSAHTDEFVVIMTPGQDHYHKKLVSCIRSKAYQYDLQLVGRPGYTIKLRKLS